MKTSVLVSAVVVLLLNGPVLRAAQVDESRTGTEDPATPAELPEEDESEKDDSASRQPIGSNDQDPSVMLQNIQQRRTQRDSLFKASPLGPLHDAADKGADKVSQATHINLGLSFHHLFQWLSDSLPGTDGWGTATDADLIANWELVNRGKPYQGNLYFHLESRWNWGTTGPMSLGPTSLGMLQNTGNTYEKYVPVSIIRNLYWQMGSEKSKGAFRIGKVTIDSILATSRHLTPVTTFLTFAATGPFAIGLPDSGLGVVGAWHFNDRVKLLGAVTDSNANRVDFGDIGAGDFFTALELGVKIAPKTEKSGFSKFTLWHNDGTSDGQPINGSNGPEGWGYFLLHEQELSKDGNLVAVFKYGHSFDDSAFYISQASASLLLYDPHFIGTITNDVVAASFNWVDPVTEGSRPESNVEVIYRFPFFPGIDTTLSYMAVINPALDPNNDFASVFSIRLVSVF